MVVAARFRFSMVACLWYPMLCWALMLFWLLGQFGWSGASGNPGGNGFFRVIGSKAFNPGGPFLRIVAECVLFVPVLRRKARSLRRASFLRKVVRLSEYSDITGEDILSPLDLVFFPLQAGKPIFQTRGHMDQLVNGTFGFAL